MSLLKRTVFTFLIIIYLLTAKTASAGATLYTDRTAFEAQLDPSSIIRDDYEHPGYTSGDIVHIDTELEKKDVCNCDN